MVLFKIHHTSTVHCKIYISSTRFAVLQNPVIQFTLETPILTHRKSKLWKKKLRWESWNFFFIPKSFPAKILIFSIIIMNIHIHFLSPYWLIFAHNREDPIAKSSAYKYIKSSFSISRRSSRPHWTTTWYHTYDD